MIQNILIFIICSNVYLAQDFIDRFINHYINLDTYSLEFDYVTKDQSEIVYSQKGSLFFSKSKFRIVLTDLIFLLRWRKSLYNSSRKQGNKYVK